MYLSDVIVVMCRDAVETVSHIFLDCIYCSGDISDLKGICMGRRLEYDIRNLFTTGCLKHRVEFFLSKVFADRFVFLFSGFLCHIVIVFICCYLT